MQLIDICNLITETKLRIGLFQGLSKSVSYGWTQNTFLKCLNKIVVVGNMQKGWRVTVD